MRTETKTVFISDDGVRFKNATACLEYEDKRAKFNAMITPKVGEYTDKELMIGGHALLDSIPFKAPWMSAFGAGFINITDVRRTDGVLEFQIADELCVPYEDGNAWCKAEEFYSEWPD